MTPSGGGSGYYSCTATPAEGYIFQKWTCSYGDEYKNPTMWSESQALIIAYFVQVVNVTDVQLDMTVLRLTVGGNAATLTATVAPNNATYKNVTWTTSDPTVATVANGVVTAVGAGTATITATATNGTTETSDDKTAACNVTVAKGDNPLTYPVTQTVTKTFSTSNQTNELAAATNGQGDVSYAIQSQKDSSNADVTHFTLEGTTLTLAENTPAGTYTVVVRATAAGNDNYKSGTKDSTVSVTVSKANPTNTVGQLSAFRGQTLANVALPTAENGVWSWEDDMTTTLNELGMTTHFAKFTPNDTNNYNTLDNVSVQIEVAEKPMAVPATVTANNRTYDGTEKPLVTVDNSTLVGGTMQFASGTKDGPTVSYTGAIPAAKKVGTYYVWYMVDGNEWRRDSTPTCILVTNAETKGRYSTVSGAQGIW